MRQLPHIARQLRNLPRTSRDRKAIEELLEEISQDSLQAVDKWMAIVDERRSDRIKAGQKAASRRGVHCGRPKAAFDRDRALQLHLQGRSIRRIATMLHVGRDTVARLFQPPRASPDPPPDPAQKA